MVNFSALKLNNKEPVYTQIAWFVKRQILLKHAVAGDEMPSRRELAFLLDINPNTVQKAFKLMEDEGYIKTESNVRSTVYVDHGLYEKIEQELTYALVKDFVDEAREVGLTYDRVLELIHGIWHHKEEGSS
jgi:GntR family transcriptional regulator